MTPSPAEWAASWMREGNSRAAILLWLTKNMSLPKLLSASVVVFSGLIFPTLALAATLSLNPATGSFTTGCSYSANIVLDTAGAQTDGVDAVIDYDPSRYTITSLTKGTLYPDYPALDYQNSKISISGIAAPTQPYSNSGGATFATINFTIPQNAPTGAANLNFEFSPGSTTQSNVVQTGTIAQLLSNVVNGNYTIVNGSSCNAVTPAPVGNTSGNSTGTGSVGGVGGLGVASGSASVASGSGVTTLPGKGGLLSNTADVTPTALLTIVGILLTGLGIVGVFI